MRKFAIIFLAIICVGAGVLFIVRKRFDVHHSADRRLWKNRAVVAIASNLQDPEYLKKRFGEIPKPRGELDTSITQWKTADTIVCRDSSWLAYRAQCHKSDRKVHDIFIAKASDGTWCYSDYHFCIDLMMLEEQPESLMDFKYRYFMIEFDGSSDEALDPTWIPVGEQRYSKSEPSVIPEGQ